MRHAAVAVLGWNLLAFVSTAFVPTVTAEPTVSRVDGWSEMATAIQGGSYRKIEAIVVERGGAMLFERYFGRTDRETRIDARSAGKSITALAVGVALDDGSIDSVEQPLFELFESEAPWRHDGPVKRAITLADVLTMSSALECDDWKKSPGNEERMYRSADWTRFALDLPIEEGYARGPGGRGRYSYCTAGAFLLGRVIERASGEAFDTFVRKRLFAPLGIDGAVWKRSPRGRVQSGGQLSLRAADFARLGRLVLDGGESDGRSLVSRNWLREMLQPRIQATPRDGYGYLWWVRDFYHAEAPHPGFFMSGNGGNKIVLFPDLDAVVVILSTNYNRAGMHEQTTELIERYVLPALVATPAADG